MRSRMIQFISCNILVSTIKGLDSLFKKNDIFISFEDFKNNKPAIGTLKLHLLENRGYRRTVQYETGSPDSLGKIKGIFGNFQTVMISV